MRKRLNDHGITVDKFFGGVFGVSKIVHLFKEGSMRYQPAIRCVQLLIGSAATMLVLAGPSAAADGKPSEGKQLFDEYRCSSCHGRNAITGASPNVPALAGRNADELFVKSKRYIDAEPQNLAWKDCGQTPSYKDARTIAEYVASLPSK
jgi:cytochrome c553